jgi:DNA processing protein
VSTIDVCDDCARRSWLVARLSGHLEHRRAEREVIREVLALPDARFIAALGGLEGALIAGEHAERDPTELRATWSAAGTHAVCRHRQGYPESLLMLPDAPAVLHLRGDTQRLADLLAGPSVAIVGARKASVEALECARLIGRGLSAAGVTVVSGMALGIDSAAHEGALEAAANTIAVLACGPDVAYPRSRRGLHGRLGERAAVISELPPGTTPYRWGFPARNRIIAALAQMVVVVEAAERSGSLITADIGITLGRDIAAVPGSPVSWRCSGTNQLLREGATFVRDAVDVLDSLADPEPCDLAEARAAGPSARRIAPPVPEGLPVRLQNLLRAIDGGAESVNAHARTPEEARAVLGDLTELELLGLVGRGPGGRYTRIRG